MSKTLASSPFRVASSKSQISEPWHELGPLLPDLSLKDLFCIPALSQANLLAPGNKQWQAKRQHIFWFAYVDMNSKPRFFIQHHLTYKNYTTLMRLNFFVEIVHFKYLKCELFDKYFSSAMSLPWNNLSGFILKSCALKPYYAPPFCPSRSLCPDSLWVENIRGPHLISVGLCLEVDSCQLGIHVKKPKTVLEEGLPSFTIRTTFPLFFLKKEDTHELEDGLVSTILF